MHEITYPAEAAVPYANPVLPEQHAILRYIGRLDGVAFVYCCMVSLRTVGISVEAKVDVVTNVSK